MHRKCRLWKVHRSVNQSRAERENWRVTHTELCRVISCPSHTLDMQTGLVEVTRMCQSREPIWYTFWQKTPSILTHIVVWAYMENKGCSLLDVHLVPPVCAALNSKILVKCKFIFWHRKKHKLETSFMLCLY